MTIPKSRSFYGSPAFRAILAMPAFLLMLLCMQAGAFAQATATQTTLTLSSATFNSNTSMFGDVVTMQAAVTAGGNPITGSGTVLFCEGTPGSKPEHACSDIRLIGTAQVVSPGGMATIKMIPRLGAHSYYALFLGTPNGTPTKYSSSPSTAVQLSVNGGPVEVEITESGTGPYTLTATVTAQGSTKAPTTTAGKLIQFQDLAAGGAVLSTNALSPLGAPVIKLAGNDIYSTEQKQTAAEAVGDFNGDGLPDVAVINNGRTDQHVDIFLGQPNGTLQLQPTIDVTVATPPRLNDLADIKAADFNNDGKLDLAISFQGSGNMRILQGEGTGGFTALPKLSGLPDYGVINTYTGMAAADLDGDGNIDIAVATQNGDTLVILKGDGNFGFTPQPTPVTFAQHPRYVVAAYIDDDDFLDLAVTNWTNTSFDPPTYDSKLHVLKGDGQLGFTEFTGSPITMPDGPNGLVAGNVNFDTDKYTDLIVSNVIASNVVLLTGNNDGTFAMPSDLLVGNYQGARWPVLADFDGDGKPDLAASFDTDNKVIAKLGNGAGNFATALTASPLTITTPRQIVAGDFNGDGVPDLVATSINDNSVAIAPVGVTTAAKADTVPQLASAIGDPNDHPHPMQATYLGDALYADQTSRNRVTLPAQKVKTTIVFTSGYPSPSSPREGDEVTLSATLSTDPSGPFTTIGETVEFWDGPPTVIGSQRVTLAYLDKNKVATADPIQLVNRTYQLYAYFPETQYFKSAQTSSELNYPVGLPPPRSDIVLTVANPAGTIITFDAHVNEVNPPTNGDVNPGTVLFCVAGAPYCTGPNLVGSAQLDATGHAKLDTYLTGTNAVLYKAWFLGTEANLAAISDPQIATGATMQAPTTTALDATGTGTPNQYKLKATVTSTRGGNPDGKVEFFAPGMVLIHRTDLTSSALAALSLNRTPFPTIGGSNAVFIATGDFDQDHHLDLAVANHDAGQVNLLKGTGAGTFAPFTTPFTTPLTATAPRSIVAADFNSDGKLDLVVAEQDAGKGIKVFRGKGNQGFDTPAETSTGNEPYALAAGDFDGDGNLDLAVASFANDNVATLLGDGSLTFTPVTGGPVSAGTNLGPVSVVVAKINQDDIPDLAVANKTDTSVSLFQGKGEGKFAFVSNVTLTNAPQHMAGSDYNNDGHPDLVIANGDGTISVLLGSGSWSFTEKDSSVANAKATTYVAAGDFNLDGKEDVAVSDASAKFVAVMIGKGDGTFDPALSKNTPPGADPAGALAIGDFNEDGTPDAIAARDSTDGLQLVVASLAGQATATLATPVNVAGNNQPYMAVYLGSAGFVTSQDTKVLSGAGNDVKISFNPPSGSVLLEGDSVQVAVAGNPANSLEPTPAGNVNLTFNGVNLGPFPLTNGKTPWVPLSGVKFTNSLEADYSGDSFYQGKTATAHYGSSFFFMGGTQRPPPVGQGAAPARAPVNTNPAAPMRKSEPLRPESGGVRPVVPVRKAAEPVRPPTKSQK